MTDQSSLSLENRSDGQLRSEAARALPERIIWPDKNVVKGGLVTVQFNGDVKATVPRSGVKSHGKDSQAHQLLLDWSTQPIEM